MNGGKAIVAGKQELGLPGLFRERPPECTIVWAGSPWHW